MITTIVASLVTHLYALVHAILGWANAAPTPLVDGIIGAVMLALLCFALWLAFGGDEGAHRMRTMPAVVKLPKAPPALEHRPRHTAPAVGRVAMTYAIDDCPTIELELDESLPLEAEDASGVHVGAHEGWHPAEDVAAVDNAEAEWDGLLRRARAELAELHAGDLEFFDQWDAMITEFRARVDGSLATAQGWHAEHGRHCACCNAGADAAEGAAVYREWRIDGETIEIPVAQLVAAGVR